MTDVEQPASVPSFGGFGKFVVSLVLLYSDSVTLEICQFVCWFDAAFSSVLFEPFREGAIL